MTIVLSRMRGPHNVRAKLEQRLRSGTATPTDLVKLGREYLRTGDQLRAAEMGFRARKADPNFPEAHQLLGALYASGGDPIKARSSYLQAARLAPDWVVPRLALARLEIDLGNGGAALEHTQSAINLDRDNAEAWLLAGKLQRIGRSPSTARASFQRSLRTDPNNPETHLEVGLLSLETDNFGEAVPPLQRAYDLGLRSPELLASLALALMASPGGNANVARAEQLLTEVGDAPILQAWFASGLIRQQRRELEKAEAMFKKVLEANPLNERAQYALAACYRQAGRRSEAERATLRHDQMVRDRQRLKELRLQAQAAPGSLQRLKAYGIALFETGYYADAEAQFNVWRQRAPGDPAAAEWVRKAGESLRRSRAGATQ